MGVQCGAVHRQRLAAAGGADAVEVAAQGSHRRACAEAGEVDYVTAGEAVDHVALGGAVRLGERGKAAAEVDGVHAHTGGDADGGGTAAGEGVAAAA